MQKRSLFLTFEGMDGSGKTTQMRLLAERLRARGREVLETAEPGGTRIGIEIRRILLDAANQELAPTAEMLLYFACRAQNVDEWIVPALAAGKMVLSDRFTDSTLVYQGCGRGLGAETVLTLDRIACRGLAPDLTLLIDIDARNQPGARACAQCLRRRTTRRAWTSKRWNSIARCMRHTTRWRRATRSVSASSTAAPEWGHGRRNLESCRPYV